MSVIHGVIMCKPITASLNFSCNRSKLCTTTVARKKTTGNHTKLLNIVNVMQQCQQCNRVQELTIKNAFLVLVMNLHLNIMPTEMRWSK